MMGSLGGGDKTLKQVQAVDAERKGWTQVHWKVMLREQALKSTRSEASSLSKNKDIRERSAKATAESRSSCLGSHSDTFTDRGMSKTF